jgi:hypothetical protein
MAGMLSSVREEWATFLRENSDSGAAAYFGAAPAIEIYTEKLKSIDQIVTDALKRLGLTVMIVTVVARDAKNQMAGLAFGDVACVARVFENPKLNATGVSASDCAEAIAWFTRRFSFEGQPLRLVEISLGDDPRALTYDVIFSLEAQRETAPTRPPV